MKIPFGPAGSLTIFHVLCEPIAHECFSSVFILFHLVNPLKKGNWYAIYLLGIDTLKNRIIKMKIPMLSRYTVGAIFYYCLGFFLDLVNEDGGKDDDAYNDLLEERADPYQV